MEAAIVLRNDVRYVAYMHLNVPAGGNLLAFLFQDGPRYTLLARWRTYVDRLVGPESKDRRLVIPPAVLDLPDDDAALAYLDAFGSSLQSALAFAGAERNTFRLVEGTVQELMQCLAADPMMTLTIESIE